MNWLGLLPSDSDLTFTRSAILGTIRLLRLSPEGPNPAGAHSPDRARQVKDDQFQQGVLRVRIPPVSATCVASLFSLACLAAPALAQGVPPAQRQPAAAASSAGMNVAVIDVARVFKNHVRFNAAMTDIKTEIDQFEAQVRERQRALRAKGEGLANYKAGSPEFRKLEEELARTESDMKIEVGLKKRELLEQEARVYYRVYKEIEQEVAVIASRFRIRLVLRYNAEEMKEDDRNSVLQGVNRAVVFQQDLDITNDVLAVLNQGTTVPPAGNRQPTTGGPTGTSAKGGSRPIIPTKRQ